MADRVQLCLAIVAVTKFAVAEMQILRAWHEINPVIPVKARSTDKEVCYVKEGSSFNAPGLWHLEDVELLCTVYQILHNYI